MPRRVVKSSASEVAIEAIKIAKIDARNSLEIPALETDEFIALRELI